MWFESWHAIGRIAIASVVGYIALVLFLRISGKRTLSKLSAFDLVVTVALGSTLASLIISTRTPIVHGVFALAMLIALQYVVAWGIVRSPRFHGVVTSEPRLLFHRGEFLRGAMRDERLGEDELRAAVREQGLSSMDEVAAVVIETSGDLSVTRAGAANPTALAGVRRVS